MDIQMPEMNGYEATQAIRSMSDPLKARMPICAMTAGVTKEEIDKCFEVGMDDFVPKPFTEEELKAKVIQYAKISH